MLKHTIKISEYTDPKNTLQNFRDLCDRSNLTDANALYEQVEHALNEFAERGSQLVAVGSQFNISRTLEGDDFKIVLEASYGEKQSLFGKIRNLLGI
jgi:hypothetical protein